MLLINERRSSPSGNGRSSRVSASSRSLGGVQAPLQMTSVWGVLRSEPARFRSIRAIPGSSQKRWKSLTSNRLGVEASSCSSHCRTAMGCLLPNPSWLSAPLRPLMKFQSQRRRCKRRLVCSRSSKTLCSSVLRTQIRGVRARISRSSWSLHSALFMTRSADAVRPSVGRGSAPPRRPRSLGGAHRDPDNAPRSD